MYQMCASVFHFKRNKLLCNISNIQFICSTFVNVQSHCMIKPFLSHSWGAEPPILQSWGGYSPPSPPVPTPMARFDIAIFN